jgi:hypothetical protein
MAVAFSRGDPAGHGICDIPGQTIALRRPSGIVPITPSPHAAFILLSFSSSRLKLIEVRHAGSMRRSSFRDVKPGRGVFRILAGGLAVRRNKRK